MQTNKETKIVKYNEDKEEEMSVKDLIQYIKILAKEGMDTFLLVKELIWKIGQTEEYLDFFQEDKGYLKLREDIDPVLYRLISKIYGKTNILESAVDVCKVRNFGEAYKIGNCRLVRRLLELFNIGDAPRLPPTRCPVCMNMISRKYSRFSQSYRFKHYETFFTNKLNYVTSAKGEKISIYDSDS